MSHITSIKTQIKDLTALETAASSIGLKLVVNQKTFLNFAGRQSPCDHAIVIEGDERAYQIGVVSNKDGTYGLQWDTWSGGKGMVARVGADANILRQAYSVEASAAQLQRQGFRVNRIKQDNGKMKLQATR